MEPLKVLFIMGSMEIGGVQSGIMNFAKVVSPDDAKIDVLVQSADIGFHEEEFKKYGNIYHLPIDVGNGRLACAVNLIRNNFSFKNKLIAFLKEHNYDVVHCKSLYYCAAAAEAAKKAGVPVRVVQSHVDKPERMHWFFKWYFNWCAKRIQKSATVKLAVSEKAADYLYGKYGGRVIKNPTISLERLNPHKYPNVPHDDIRLIQIGTFSKRKNQCFSIEILKSLLDKGYESRLTIIGFSLDDPTYIDQINETINSGNLENYVEFLPKDADVPKALSESDYMLIPSLREGLPNVALESQAMGVPCFISENVWKATDCGLCQFLALELGAEKWADSIITYRNEHGNEKTYIDMSDWDNRNVCKEYIEIWRGNYKNI
jgi:glycosyltransferase EpsF